MVLELGGSTTQAVNKTDGAASVVAIAGRLTVRVKAVIEHGTIDVVRPDWLRRCRAASVRVPFDRDLMIAVRPATDQKLLQETDRWGDSYFEDTDSASLKNVLGRVVVPEHWGPAEVPRLRHFEETWQSELSLPPLRTSIFRAYTVYVDRWAGVGEGPARPSWRLEQAEAMLRFYGAEVVPNLDSYASHVVMEPSHLAHLPTFRRQVRARLATAKVLHVVSPDWVFDSARLHEDMDEGPFTIELGLD